MTYFTFQRIITLIVGLVILCLANLAFQVPSPIFKYGLALIAGLIGIYVVIASLIPRFISYLFKIITDLFH